MERLQEWTLCGVLRTPWPVQRRWPRNLLLEHDWAPLTQSRIEGRALCVICGKLGPPPYAEGRLQEFSEPGLALCLCACMLEPYVARRARPEGGKAGGGQPGGGGTKGPVPRCPLTKAYLYKGWPGTCILQPFQHLNQGQDMEVV